MILHYPGRPNVGSLSNRGRLIRGREKDVKTEQSGWNDGSLKMDEGDHKPGNTGLPPEILQVWFQATALKRLSP